MVLDDPHFVLWHAFSEFQEQSDRLCKRSCATILRTASPGGCGDSLLYYFMGYCSRSKILFCYYSCLNSHAPHLLFVHTQMECDAYHVRCEASIPLQTGQRRGSY